MARINICIYSSLTQTHSQQQNTYTKIDKFMNKYGEQMSKRRKQHEPIVDRIKVNLTC